MSKAESEPMKNDNRSSEVIAIKVGLTLREVEKLLIEATLRHTDHNISRCAAILGIDRSTLYAKCKEYGLK